MVKLSSHESHLLALIGKWQPTTAYSLCRALKQTVGSDISDSPGSVYPAIDRLKRRGLVTAQAVERGKRRSEHLRCTADGELAIREWICRFDPGDRLPHDWLRTRVSFIGMLGHDIALDWLLRVRGELEDELSSLTRMAMDAVGEGHALALGHARATTAARLAWIEEAVAALAAKEHSPGASTVGVAPPSADPDPARHGV